MNIEMADLRRQYHRLKPEIDAALQEVLESTAFINGPQVKSFAVHLAEYLNVPHVIPCGNGTDAIQMALMALNLQPGDEVIVPAFTYISAVEAVAMLGLVPVLVDVDPETFNLNIEQIEQAISWQTKAVIAVHLFGQLCDMQPLMTLAKRYHLYVVEDNAQSLGAECLYPDGKTQKGDDRTYRDDLLFSFQAACLLRGRRCNDHAGRYIGGNFAADCQSWPDLKVQS